MIKHTHIAFQWTEYDFSTPLLTTHKKAAKVQIKMSLRSETEKHSGDNNRNMVSSDFLWFSEKVLYTHKI